MYNHNTTEYNHRTNYDSWIISRGNLSENLFKYFQKCITVVIHVIDPNKMIPNNMRVFFNRFSLILYCQLNTDHFERKRAYGRAWLRAKPIGKNLWYNQLDLNISKVKNNIHIADWELQIFMMTYCLWWKCM